MKYKPIFLFLVLISQYPLLSQNSSTYTRYGIGDVEYSYSARRLGMGQLGISVADADFIGHLNPAGWNKISKTRLEFGINYNGLLLSDNNQSKYYAETDFNGFTFAFPASQLYGVGIALGLVPFSNVSYNAVNNYSSPDPSISDYKINFKGNGGLSKLFIGSSYNLPFNLSIGATLDYYFGNIEYTSNIIFEDEKLLSAEYIRTYQPTGLGTTVGIISPDFSQLFNSENLSDLRLGAALNYISGLTTDTSLVSINAFGPDTISSGLGTMEIPIRISFGLSFILNTKYLISLDYAVQPWTDFNFNNVSSSNLRDAFKVSAGFEYRPPKELGLTFWELFMWRAGFSYEKTQYVINGKGIDQFSVAAGFSLPLSHENTIDFGVQYAMRGTKEAGLLKENIFKLNLGISLGEIWFIRQDK
jgi:hypothetical protein